MPESISEVFGPTEYVKIFIANSLPAHFLCSEVRLKIWQTLGKFDTLEVLKA